MTTVQFYGDMMPVAWMEIKNIFLVLYMGGISEIGSKLTPSAVNLISSALRVDYQAAIKSILGTGK